MKKGLKWIVLVAIWTMLTGCAAYSEFLGSVAENVSRGIKVGQERAIQPPHHPQESSMDRVIVIEFEKSGNTIVVLPDGVPDFHARGVRSGYPCPYDLKYSTLRSHMKGIADFEILYANRAPIIKSLIAHYPNGEHRFWIYPNGKLNHSGQPEEVVVNEWALFLELDLAKPMKGLNI